jgi:DNA primase
MPLSRFVIESARDGCDLETAEGRALLASQAKPLIQLMPEGVLKSQLISELSDLVLIGSHELLRLWGATSGPGSAKHSGPHRHGSRAGSQERSMPSGQTSNRFTMARRDLNPTRSFGLRRHASNREDRAIQLLFSEMQAWDRLSAMQQHLLCELPDPHGMAFRWLDQQWQEHGPLSWPALAPLMGPQPMGDWVSQLMSSAPAELVFEQDELDSILREMEKLSVSKELSAIAPQVGQDPTLFERFKELNQRLIQLKAGSGA